MQEKYYNDFYMYHIVGLGNPGKEYELSRHNAGRIAFADFLKKNAGVKISEMDFNKKLNALVFDCRIGDTKSQIIFPETFMNKSGASLKQIITSKKKAENLIVVHDDIDLPFGTFKISFGKSAGGHKGVESIIKAIKTKDFIRIRIGVSPSAPNGKTKKLSADKVIDFIMGNFKPKELEIIKKISKKITSAIEMIVGEGVQRAMSVYN